MTPLLLWLALGQAPDAGVHPELSVEPSTERRQLDYDREVWCGTLAPSRAVPSGLRRIQCDDEKRECLAAPQRVLVDGVESEEELARTRLCLPLFDDRVRVKAREGYRFVEAIAEAPDGWFRDERGRIIQVNFDLHRRVYFGGAWAPQLLPDQGFTLNRGRTDFGIEIDLDPNGGHDLHRLRILEGSAWVGADSRVDAALLRYSWSSQHLAAPLWLTTFVGHPRRFDLDLNLTGWFEALHWELVGGMSFLTVGAAAASLDLWHSKDLDSFVRLRLGPGLEFDALNKGWTVKPMGALEADFTLDRDGFHHLTGAVWAEKLFLDEALAGRRLNPERLRIDAGYEVILLAINDYPLSLVLDARATWRDDLVNVKPGWDFGAQAGLRFSFWAPARRNAGRVAFH